MKKKILIYMQNLVGGGAERTVVNIINNIDKSKFDIVLVIKSEEQNDYLYLLDKTIKIIYLYSTTRMHTIAKLSKVIRNEKPTLLFSTINMNNIILMLSKLLSFKRIPIVLREANNRSQSGTVTMKNKIVTSILYNMSDIIISLSKGVAEDLKTNFKIRDRKIHIIYNPVDLQKINDLKEEKITDVDFNNDEKIIISVGKLGEQKDYPTLLNAFKIVAESIKAKLLILGKGAEENHLRELTKKMGISEKVLFLGFKDNPYKYMKRADVFVLSSKWEGFGHVIVEAMAVGTPIIATDCNSGPAEIIGNNEYGLLVPVGDFEAIANKIFYVLENKEQYVKYIELGLARTKDFYAPNIVNQYEKVFEKLSK